MSLRTLSAIERLWLHAGEPGVPFALSIVVQGQGALDGLQAAVTQAASANPGMRARLQQGLWAPRWVLGPVPQVVQLGALEPGALDWLPDAPFQVGVAPGPTLVVTAHHALMDGRGLWHVVQEIGRALRGDDLLGGDDAIDDRTLLTGGRAVPTPPGQVTAATGPFTTGARPVWATRRVTGRWSVLTARLVAAVAAHARRDASERAVRVDVPVDLRDGRRTSANLTGIVPLVVPAHATPEGVDQALRDALDRGDALRWLQTTQTLRRMPDRVLGPLVRHKASQARASDTWDNTAVVSNLGRVDPQTLSAPGFHATRVFWIPPCAATTSVFLGILGDAAGVEITAVAPAGLGDQGRLDALLDRLAATLTVA